MGYKTLEVPVNGKKTLNINLKEDTEMLDEVVVVGFGTQKKVNLTGSVGTVDSEALASRPVQNAVQALQGVVPGLQITTTSGALDNKMSMSIRGTGTIGDGSDASPLVLIDGMEGDINSINPQDIENISILKDAAAALVDDYLKLAFADAFDRRYLVYAYAAKPGGRRPGYEFRQKPCPSL